MRRTRENKETGSWVFFKENEKITQGNVYKKRGLDIVSRENPGSRKKTSKKRTQKSKKWRRIEN